MKRRPRPVWATVAIFSLVAGYSVLSPQARANELAWRTYNEAGENFVKQRRYADAEQVLIHALEAAKETKSKEHLRASLELLIKVYDSLKKVENAKSAREQLSILGFPVPPLPVEAAPATAPASAAALPVAASSAQGQTGVRSAVPATGIGQGAQSSGQPGKTAFVGSSAPAGGFVAPPVASRTPFTPSNGFASGAAPQVIRFSSVTGQPINAPTSFADSQTAGAANNGTTQAFSPGSPPVDVAPAIPTKQQSIDLSAESQSPSPSGVDAQKAPVDGSSSAAPGGDVEKPQVDGSSSAAPNGAGANLPASTNASQPLVTSAANQGRSGANPSVPDSTLSQPPAGGGADSGLAQATGSGGSAMANTVGTKPPSGDAFANATSDASAAALDNTQQSAGAAASYGSYEDGVEKLKDQAAAVPSPSDNVGGDSEIVELRGPNVPPDSSKTGAAPTSASGSSGSLPGATNNQSHPEESLPLRNEIRSAEQKNLSGGSAPSTRIDVKDESADIAELSTAAPKSVDMTDLRTPDPKDSQPTGSSPSADAFMKSDTVSSSADGAPGAVPQNKFVDMSMTPATAGSANQSAPLDPNYGTSSTPGTEATNPSPASAPSVGSGSSAAQELNPAAPTSAATDVNQAVVPDVKPPAAVALQPVENLTSSSSLASGSSALPTGSSSLASSSSALPSGSSSLPSSSSTTSLDTSNPATSSSDVTTASAVSPPVDTAESKSPSLTAERTSALSTVSGAAGSTGHAQELRALQGHIDWIKALCFAPDSNFAASGGSDHVIRYWDVNQGKLLAEMPGHRDDVNGLAFSKDGTKLLSASDDKTVRMFDVASQKEEKVLTGHKNLVTCVACSPDLKQAASGGYDNAVILWDLQSGAALVTLAGHTATIRSVIFTPDGSRVISSSDDRNIIVWDAKSFKQLYKLQGHESHVLSLDISEDGKRLISGGRDLTARIWDLDSLKQVQVLDGHKDWVLRVKFMKGGSQAVTGSLDKTVRIWDLSIGSLKSAIDGFNLGIWSEDFAADKGLVLTGSNDKTVRVWALGE